MRRKCLHSDPAIGTAHIVSPAVRCHLTDRGQNEFLPIAGSYQPSFLHPFIPLLGRPRTFLQVTGPTGRGIVLRIAVSTFASGDDMFAIELIGTRFLPRG